MPKKGAALADGILLVSLLAYVVWVPMPFGSTPDFAQPPLIIPPLVLCAGAALLRLGGRGMTLRRPARIWLAGGAAFAVIVAGQLVPLPDAMLRLVSPESARLWMQADRVASLAGVVPHEAHPISIDPADTTLALFRILAYLATFAAAMLLVRGSNRRNALAVVVTATAMFETAYAVREAALGRYAIWGWKNTLIFGRATGTFVNPNHFAHHAAIALPLALFLCAHAWHQSGGPRMPWKPHLARLFEKQWALAFFGVAAVVASLVSIVLSQSRGGIVAVAGGLGVVGAFATNPRRAALRASVVAAVVILLFAAVIAVFGLSATTERMRGEGVSSGGRVSAMLTGFRLWKRFPIFGCGLGAFEDIALMVQPGDASRVDNHAHNDYVEVAATTGLAGFLVAVTSLFAGYIALARLGFGLRAVDQSWRRRAFQTAALASVTIAMVHGLFDFNFFIPANPATLAAIAGAAVSAREAKS